MPATLKRGARRKRPSGKTAMPDGKPANHRVQDDFTAPQGDCVVDPPRELTPSVERADAERRQLSEHHPTAGVHVGFIESRMRWSDEPYGLAEQRDRDERCSGAATAAPVAPNSADRHRRGPVVFADAASSRSTPSGVAACNDRKASSPGRRRPAGAGRPRDARGPRGPGATGPK
jgi:hypothetical protein